MYTESKMRPTYLPMCKCDSRRVILVDGILRCAECMAVYGEGAPDNLTDGFLNHLITRARERYPYIPEKKIIDCGGRK